MLSACSGHKTSMPKTAESNHQVPASYTTTMVEQGGVTEELKLPGQLAAYQQVSIFPKINGYVKQVLVDIGSHVKKGDLLMVLEDPELQQATLQAREKYERSVADYQLSRENFMRLKEAAQTAGAVAPLDLASARTRMMADSALVNAGKDNWAMEQTLMGYMKVYAPFSGVITQRNVHPGALVSASAGTGVPMLELKENDHLRLQVDVPQTLSASLQEGQPVFFYVDAFPGVKWQGRIARRAHDIDAKFRSEKIELDVANAAEKLSPGMYADVLLQSHGHGEAWRVPQTAVVTSTEGKYVIRMQGQQMEKIPVSTGDMAAGMVEVYGQLRSGDRVVLHANDDMSVATPRTASEKM